MTRVGVLVSGRGTNLQALIDGGIPIAVVVSDRPAITGLERATAAGVTAEVVDRRHYLPERRNEFTEAIVDALHRHGVDLVVNAGFMTILTKPMADAYEGRWVNTHPSLLPAFPGAHAVEEALDAGVKLTGVTIHFATEQVDSGPILAQEAVPVEPSDTVASLHERIKAVEHRLYPAVVRRLMAVIDRGQR